MTLDDYINRAKAIQPNLQSYGDDFLSAAYALARAGQTLEAVKVIQNHVPQLGLAQIKALLQPMDWDDFVRMMERFRHTLDSHD